ncbi:MAG: hypothetical protein RI544_07650, partial [Haloquadratum sp.]|nr:hypothetical protein [Haloquadratum sp.]
MRLDLDGQILALAIARMVAALANSFLIVVLPLYLGSVYVQLPDVVGGDVVTHLQQHLATDVRLDRLA